MNIDFQTLVARLSRTPPRGIKSAWPRALRSPSKVLEDSGDIVFTSWAIGVLADDSPCMVMGEPTSITADPPERILLGSLGLMYQTNVVEVFDPVIHGFNNEIDVIDAKIAKPPQDVQLLSQRKPFECEYCPSKSFLVTVNVYYQYGTVDLLLKYSDLPSSDLFNSFNVYGTCATCQRQNIIAEVDGL